MSSYLASLRAARAARRCARRSTLLAGRTRRAPVRRRHRPDGAARGRARCRTGRYLSLWQLRELRGIDVIGERRRARRADDLHRRSCAHAGSSSASSRCCGAAARETGGIATQNRGTLGGNIANASPAADSPPALLVYDAELELRLVRGPRRVPYATSTPATRRWICAPTS